MQLDNEQQREILLQLIRASTFPGGAVDEAYELKKAIENATIQEIKKK